MSEGEFLLPPEVRQLAGKAELAAQGEVLRLLGIPHRTVGRRVLVSRHHVRAWLEGKPMPVSREVNLGAVK